MTRRSFLFLLAFLISLGVSSRSASTAPEQQLLGFTPSATEKQKELERRIIGAPSGKHISEYHKVMTSAPHHAGTPANEEFANYYAERLQEFGFDEVSLNYYEVLLPRPKKRQRQFHLLASPCPNNRWAACSPEWIHVGMPTPS